MNSNKVNLPNFILKYKHYLRLAPLLGLPIFVYFPVGITMYWNVISGFQFLIAYAFSKQKTLEYFKILKNSNQEKKIIKSVYVDDNITEQITSEPKQNVVKVFKNKPKKK